MGVVAIKWVWSTIVPILILERLAPMRQALPACFTKLRLVYQESSTGGQIYIVSLRMAERKVDGGGDVYIHCRLQPKIGTCSRRFITG